MKTIRLTAWAVLYPNGKPVPNIIRPSWPALDYERPTMLASDCSAVRVLVTITAAKPKRTKRGKRC